MRLLHFKSSGTWPDFAVILLNIFSLKYYLRNFASKFIYNKYK